MFSPATGIYSLLSNSTNPEFAKIFVKFINRRTNEKTRQETFLAEITNSGVWNHRVQPCLHNK